MRSKTSARGAVTIEWEEDVHDWNALALLGVASLGMATSAALLIRSLVLAFRTPPSR